MKVVSMQMVETGTYGDMVARPHSIQVEQDDLNEFADRFNSGHTSATSLAGFAGRLIRPAGASQRVGIDNGWGERRFRFMMKVAMPSVGGTVNYEVLTGYTDQCDVSFNKTLDPRMRVFFNNAVHMRETQERTRDGLISRSYLNDASHVLFKSGDESYGGRNPTGNFLIRPEDVVTNMSLGDFAKDRTVYDGRTTLVGEPKKSRRSNAIAPYYLTRTLGAINKAYTNPDNFSENDMTMYEHARNSLEEGTVYNDSFLNTLRDSRTFTYHSYVEWGELTRIYPEIEEVGEVFFQGNARLVSRVANRGEGENLDQVTMEATVATILSNTVPALLVDSMLHGIIFRAHNRTTSGKFVVDIQDHMSLTNNADLSNHIQYFIDRLIGEVLLDVTRNNQMDLGVSMECKVDGDSFITVSIGSGYDVEFEVPTFCDALFAPVVVNNRSALDNMSMNLDMMYDHARSQSRHGYGNDRSTNFSPDRSANYDDYSEMRDSDAPVNNSV